MKLTATVRALQRCLIYGRSAHIQPHEAACLESWRKVLAPDALPLLDAQLRRLSFMQRQAKGRLLCFYDTGGESVDHWPQNILSRAVYRRLRLRA